MNVKAPQPFLRIGKPANSFRQLRKATTEACGHDFLAVVGDMFRAKTFASSKPGVATRSRHKCGDAFDYNQDDSRVIVVLEQIAQQHFFRTYIRCVRQDGSQGIKLTLKNFRGVVSKDVWVIDFTALAQKYGFERIPAWKGYTINGAGYSKMEFWHYQCTEGLSYDEAINFLYGQTSVHATVNDVRLAHFQRTLGLNDRGAAVRNIQERLAKLGLLPRDEVDGVYGQPTRTVVVGLQEQHGLTTDGLVDAQTRALLESLTR
jgi:hypothetical protein